MLSDEEIDELAGMADVPVGYDGEPDESESVDLVAGRPDPSATHWSGWWSALELHSHSHDVRVWRGPIPAPPPAFSRSAEQVSPGYAWMRMDAPAGDAGTGSWRPFDEEAEFPVYSWANHGFLVPVSLLTQAGVWTSQWQPVENGRVLPNTLKLITRIQRAAGEVTRAAYVTPGAGRATCWSSVAGSRTFHFANGTRPTIVDGRFLVPVGILHCLSDLGEYDFGPGPHRLPENIDEVNFSYYSMSDAGGVFSDGVHDQPDRLVIVRRPQ